ncbi:MAG: sodium-dependent transporter [Cellulomonadaceae bacterium]|nr:sodium-dependent transporter [Cellulomonadaceae bacterium]
MSTQLDTAPAPIAATLDSVAAPRSVFRTKLGFVLAAAGSAVGLGNVWRFPYFAATYGGGTFLFAYLLIAFVFGLTIMVTEIAIGRATGSSPLAAFGKISPKFKFVGVLALAVPAIIFPYYSVIGGWVGRYAFSFLTGGGAAAAEAGYFGSFISGVWSPIFWLAVFIAFCAFFVALGVQKGIEKINLVGMPVFIVMLIALAAYGLTLPGAMDGFLHYVRPDFSELSVNTFIAATRQIFFSLSLSMGVMITYGSYLKKQQSIEKSSLQIAGVDTGVSLVAGALVIPVVVAFMGVEGLGQGAGMLFVTIPQVFALIPGGGFVGALFFTLMFIAAATSGISLMEPTVAALMEKTNWTRKKAALLIAVGSFALAMPTTLGFGVWNHIRIGHLDMLGMMSFLTDTLLMPIVALLTAVMIGWVVGPKVIAAVVTDEGKRFRAEKVYTFVIKWIAPPALVAIFASSLLLAFGVISL